MDDQAILHTIERCNQLLAEEAEVKRSLHEAEKELALLEQEDSKMRLFFEQASAASQEFEGLDLVRILNGYGSNAQLQIDRMHTVIANLNAVAIGNNRGQKVADAWNLVKDDINTFVKNGGTNGSK